jgi:gluconate 2-dehydrogenase gamma chain
MDRIVPPDDYPGAWDSGVGDYLTRQLAGDLRDQLFHYQVGLDALDSEALASAGASFAALTAEQQEALLRRVEAGQVRHLWPIDPARFFGTVVAHVIEGYYSDPGNGANRDQAAWRMIGYVFPGTGAKQP